MKLELLYIIPSFLVLLIIVYFCVVLHYLKMLVHPKKRSFLELVEYEKKEKNFQDRYLDIPFEEMILTSNFGYNLFGRFYKNSNITNKIMISLHGHNSCSVSQMKYLEMFLSLGFNVFMPDHRYSGFSEGKSVTFGIYESLDVIQWMDSIMKDYPESVFYIFGESMGAVTSLMVAEKDQRIKSVIEYCAFANMETLVSQYISNEFLAKKVFWPSLRLLGRIIYKIDLAKSNALLAIEKIKVPILILHSKADKVVDYKNALLLSSAQKNAEFFSFEDSIHARSMVKYPDEFKLHVTNFLDKVQ